MPIVNAKADEVLKAFLREKVNGRSLKLRSNPADRLVGSFIWNRAVALTGTGAQDQGMTSAAAHDRVAIELPQVFQFIQDVLGTDRRGGPLAGGPDPGTPPHLDLTDLAKQQVSDLALTDLSVEAAKFVRVRRDDFVNSRKKAVRAIVWRAAALERELWEVPPKTLKTLDTFALKEMLDRRLRVIERMAGNVSSRGAMMRENANAKLICSDPDTGWRDGLRVRLFEYPSFGLEPLNQLGDRLSVIKQPGQDGKWKLNGGSLDYHVAPPPVTRTYDNNPGDFEILPAKIDWYFPANIKLSWVLSPGRDSCYRIDLTPASPLTGAGVIDLMFSHKGTVGGEPERADIWNRTWLLCDLVMSALELEALLFGLRRRESSSPSTDVGRVPADATFNGLVALRPNVLVHRGGEDTVTGGPIRSDAHLDTNFVSLDAHLRTTGLIEDSIEPDPKVLMRSTQPDTDAFADHYFRNRIGRIDDLQVGDWVKLISSPAYEVLASSGVWSLENALVMDIDPDVDNAKNRGGLKLTGLQLQGHGLINENYNDFRESLGTGLNNEIAFLISEIQTAELPLAPVGDPPRLRVLEWAPYADLATFVHNKAPIGKTPILETILNGPFWLPMFVGPPNTIAEALAAAPGAVGKPDVAQFNLKGDPTKNMDPKKRKRLLRLEPGEDLFDHFILFPLFQPTRGAGDDKADRLMWKTYFQHRQNNGDTREFTFHKLYADERIIPGFASSTSGGDLDQIPMIQPRPRRSRNT